MLTFSMQIGENGEVVNYMISTSRSDKLVRKTYDVRNFLLATNFQGRRAYLE